MYVSAIFAYDNTTNRNLAIRILMASSVGLPAASLCINRRLYHIATVQAVSVGPAEVMLVLPFPHLLDTKAILRKLVLLLSTP